MSRRKEFFPEVTDQQWNDWHWQVKNRIETVDELKKYIKLTAEEEEGIRESLKTLRMAITPYYLTLIDPENPHCPIRKQAIPTVEELKRSPADLEDPLHEDSDSPVPGLTHRYPDRVLFLITDMCSMYCRHCTRRRFAGQHDCATPEKQIDDCIDYIARTPQVRDVLLSGGDALLVSDEKLEYIISRLRAIPHVEIIRIGSRTPVVLPQRITPELVNMLKKYHRMGTASVAVEERVTGRQLPVEYHLRVLEAHLFHQLFGRFDGFVAGGHGQCETQLRFAVVHRVAVGLYLFQVEGLVEIPAFG